MYSENRNEEYKHLLANHLNELQIEDNYSLGYVDTQENYLKFLEDLLKLGIKFVVRCSRENNKHSEGQIRYSSMKGEVPVPFFGQPFICKKNCYLDCKFGEEYHKQVKMGTEKNGDHEYVRKNRLLLQNTKKNDCTAKMMVKQVCVYTSAAYKVEFTNSKYKMEMFQKKAASAVIEDLKRGHIPMVDRYYIKISSLGSHNHDLGIFSDAAQNIHPDLVTKIKDLVAERITSVRTIKQLLKKYVTEKFHDDEIQPSLTNSAYFPSNKCIRNHVVMAIQALKYSKIDQENLKLEIENWKSKGGGDVNFCFRPYKRVKNENPELSDDPEVISEYTDTFLFVHQDALQRHLLKKYGHFCLMDATYKVTKYALPLFFICVKTNVGYSIVAEFIVQFETSDCITEALNIIKSWNPDWQPKYSMSDFSNAELNAISTVFPTCQKYICDFHREQAWTRWVRKRGNLTSGDADALLHNLRLIAYSSTTDAFESNLTKIKTTKEWTENSSVQQYINRTWLPVSVSWVRCYRSSGFDCNLNTNNGVEAKNKLLKHCYLKNCSDKSVSGILKIIIEEYIPDLLKNYVQQNIRLSSSFAKYHPNIPKFLHNRPPCFVKHVLKRIETGMTINPEMIREIDNVNGEFQVESSTKGEFYDVNFAIPSCSCPDFDKWRYPCKHFTAIFRIFPQWSFDKLNTLYISNPQLCIDDHVFSNPSDAPSTDTTTDRTIEETSSFNNPNLESPSEFEEIDADNSELTATKATTAQRRRALDVLDRLKNAIHLCNDPHILTQVCDTVKRQAEICESSIPKENGILLEVNTQRKQLKNKSTKSYCDPNILVLPSHKKKWGKHEIYKKRFGSVADAYRKTINLELICDTATDTTSSQHESSITDITSEIDISNKENKNQQKRRRKNTK